MKNLFLIVIFSLSIFIQANAQQGALFSQYMLNPIYYNAAAAGLDGEAHVTAMHRTQYLGYESSFDGRGGAPSSQLLSFSTPFKFNELPLGLGFNFINDRQGVSNTLTMGLAFAYHFELKRARISIGIKPEIISRTIGFPDLRPNQNPDPLIPNTKESQVAPDLSLGVYYAKNNYRIGLGISHLLKPSFDFGLSQIDAPFENRLERTANISGNYTYKLAYKIILSPSILVRTDFKTYSYDLGALVTFDDKIWGGLSYRKQEAVSVIIGYAFLKDNVMKVGYSFDYVVEEQNAKQPTSHEFFVRYNLPSLVTGNKKIIRTPRFRF